MKFEIIELEGISGEKTKIYSICVDDNPLTLYEKFVSENQELYFYEVVNLDDRLKIIGNEIGILYEFFKIGAGRVGQNLCTLRDYPGSKLRLFFIDFGSATIILGDGGFKPKEARATQDVPELMAKNLLLGQISDTLNKARARGHIDLNEDGTIFSSTNFIYKTENYE